MDKKFIKISTVKRRIENILSAYNEQIKNFATQETLPSSSSCSTNTNNSSSSSTDKTAEEKKMQFSYETLDIDSILRMTEKESESKTNFAESHRQVKKRQGGALKRTSTPQLEGSAKKTQMDSDNSSTPGKKSKIRSSARQKSQRVAKVSSVAIETDSDHDENNAKAAKNN